MASLRAPFEQTGSCAPKRMLCRNKSRRHEVVGQPGRHHYDMTVFEMYKFSKQVCYTEVASRLACRQQALELQ